MPSNLMDVTLTLRCFGPMLVCIGDARLPKMRSRKALWLLALLATRANRLVAREWLASTLWPDADLATAFANLRPVLCELRKALGEHGWRIGLFDRNTVVFDARDVAIDVADFDAAIREADFEKAVHLYQGPLLEGCNEEWVAQERTAREIDCLYALETLGERALEAKDYDRALLYFGRAAGLDPWRDAPRRGLMVAFAAKRDVNAALHTYRGFAHFLGSKASMEPDAATTELYGRLRAAAKQVASRKPIEEESRTGSPHMALVGPSIVEKARFAVEVALRTAEEYSDRATDIKATPRQLAKG